MIDVVEELGDVHVHHPVPALPDISPRRAHRIVRTPPRPKSPARPAEQRLKDRRQYLQQRLLQQPVHHRRDAQPPLAPARLRYLYPPHRAWRPASRHELRPDFPAVTLKVGFELIRGHAVDPRRAAVAFYRRQRPPQVLFGHHLFHQIVVHHFLSRVSPRSASRPQAAARRGSTASALACSPVSSPQRVSAWRPGTAGLCRLCESRSSSFAPWSFRPSPGPNLTAQPLWLLLTPARLSPSRSPQVRC